MPQNVASDVWHNVASDQGLQWSVQLKFEKKKKKKNPKIENVLIQLIRWEHPFGIHGLRLTFLLVMTIRVKS